MFGQIQKGGIHIRFFYLSTLPSAQGLMPTTCAHPKYIVCRYEPPHRSINQSKKLSELFLFLVIAAIPEDGLEDIVLGPLALQRLIDVGFHLYVHLHLHPYILARGWWRCAFYEI